MSNVLQVKEGKGQLAEKERQAAEMFRVSRQSLDEGVLLLREIRDGGLWHFAVDEDGVMLGDYEKPHWETYLNIFCNRYGISRSGAFDHLNIVDTWVALGMPAESVADDHVGVTRAKYIRQMGVRLDNRTGELSLPPPDIINRLPGKPDDPPEVRIQRKIDEVYFQPEIPLRPSDLRKSFEVDAGGGPDYDCFESGGGDIWVAWSEGEQSWDGILIPKANYSEMPLSLREYIGNKLKIRKYKGG
jgi:hypothetical protein